MNALTKEIQERIKNESLNKIVKELHKRGVPIKEIDTAVKNLNSPEVKKKKLKLLLFVLATMVTFTIISRQKNR